ncbi:hypothetical protein M3Y99_00563800 [Aphelenchoides fujianensis]|nr:hypothetical protein M3Y99_00563800 [Aphelenchoides fujianensis]
MTQYGSKFMLPQHGDETELDTKNNQHLERGYEWTIERTWDNKRVEHEPIRIKMKWHFEKMDDRPHRRMIRTTIESPLFNDDPPNDFSGHCADLYNYECVELFFMNERGQYVEIEVGPHGHWLVLLHSGYRKCFNTGEEIEVDVENTYDGDKWICNLDIPLAFLPGGVTRFNAYAQHGQGEERHLEALGPVVDGSLKEPDFHRKEYFVRFDTRRVVPEGYNRKPYEDLVLGNLWEKANKQDE